jgi:hypothetical protein
MEFIQIYNKKACKLAIEIIKHCENDKLLSPRICKILIIPYEHGSFGIPIQHRSVQDFVFLKDDEYNEDGILFISPLSGFPYYDYKQKENKNIGMALSINVPYDKSIIDEELSEVINIFRDMPGTHFVDHGLDIVSIKRHMSLKEIIE